MPSIIHLVQSEHCSLIRFRAVFIAQVQALDEEFHFVLIAEHFDESLGKEINNVVEPNIY